MSIVKSWKFWVLLAAVIFWARMPWLVSNNPSAHYNRPERALTIHPETGKPQTPDRNLELSLTHLIRGSTAAPAARRRNLRRRSFMAPPCVFVISRECERRPVDTGTMAGTCSGRSDGKLGGDVESS